MRPRAAVTLLVCAALVAGAAQLSGCGSSPSSATVQDATLVLDFTPNAIHAGIYSAIARTYDQDAGVHLHVVAPSSSTDSIKLLETGRADFAILDIHDLAIARERGKDVVGIMAIVQLPLAAVLVAPQIHSPRQLDGKTVGVTGVPSDTAVLRSIVAGARGNPRRVKTITIGFNAVPALLAHRVAGATAFWNDEGVTLRRRRPGFRVFRVDRYGAPAYPELVLCATGSSLRQNPGLARGVLRALVRGYGLTRADPAGSAANLESLVPGLDPPLVAVELAAERSSFVRPGGHFGELDPRSLRAWADWEVKFGIVKRRPDLARMFNPAFLPG
ncbi:MAG: ABC transporter substrate-binding protein [Actinomycetota bacterium]|nr:ABC transporter substrate-binding protein [Actinomycetota bacterium]